MSAQMAYASPPSVALHTLAEQAGFFLLAVCIRSAEGRRRIVAETVRTLSSIDPRGVQADGQAVTHNAFRHLPDCPPPHQVCVTNPLCKLSAHLHS